MNKTEIMNLEALQKALLALDPTGSEGFEGFLGVILGEITGQSFRLAKSGSQRGRDGDSAFDGGITYFEGKRYREGLTKSEVFIKIFDVANDDSGQVDLWILGATCEVASQTVKEARAFADKMGFGIVVLDWSNNDLGSLLVAVVAASSKSKQFITMGLRGKPEEVLTLPALAAIDYFEKHADYPARLISLQKSLSEDVSLGYAKTLNQEWLCRLFTNKSRAREELGQSLSPLDPSGSVLNRPESALLTNAFSGKPNSEIYAIIGEEGVGKSWLAVQSWCLSNPKSLLVICPAEDLSNDEVKDFDEFLIRKLLHQTGVSITPQTITRWQRRFNAWRMNIPASSVRITLIADGLNQPLKSNWGRWLDRAAQHLKKLGGCLVLTTRTQHWTQLKNNVLSCDVRPIMLADWSINEVTQILDDCGIDYSKTRMEVIESVRNPRLLGIAIELIKANTIDFLDELSVGRLLFEHMRRMEQHGAALLSPASFAELLKRLAAKILERVNSQETDDLRLFDAFQESRLEAVASSRFFSSVKGSTSQYEIKSDGLNLALALYLVDQLERELRNTRDPRDKLTTILEPISALDETAKVVLLAIQIACGDEDTSQKISSALIEKFVSLQNLANSEVDAFAVLVKSDPLAFLQAAEMVYLSEDYIANDDWLLYALVNRRDNPAVWKQILKSTKRWLSFYSLDPERGMHRNLGHDSAQIEEERGKVLYKIQDREAALTEAERSFLATNLILAPHPKFDELTRFALYLLAGKHLEEIAPYLVRWRFANAINHSPSAPYAEFSQLLHFNRTDWRETRSALLQELNALPEECSSLVGKWTRVGVLYGTGDVYDAQEGDRIRVELTRDQEKFEGWSLIEDYCAVDPCDPNTKMPKNVSETVLKYRQINPGQIAKSYGMTEQDRFFRDACPGVARFAPDDAIFIHRELANEVLGRQGYERRQGVLELMRHSAALTKDLALSFLSAGMSSTASYNDEQDNRDEFITAQFSVLIALPHLTADEQIDAIAHMQGNTILRDLLLCVRKAAPKKVEEVLESVLQNGEENAQIAALAGIHYSQSPLTPRAANIVKVFLRSQLKNLRQEALAVAATSGDILLLQEVIDSGWSANKSRGPDGSFEDWYGSNVILKALQAGLLETGHALNRMNLSHYGFAAETQAVREVDAIAALIEAAIAKALGYEVNWELPDIETEMPSMPDAAPPLISLAEKASSENDFESWANRLSETDQQIGERQRRLSNSYQRFTDDLTSAEANLILSDLTFGGIKALIGQDSDRALRWIKMLITASDQKLRHLHHFALEVASLLVINGNPLAHDFLTRVLALDPSIRRVTGTAKVPMDAVIIWSNVTNRAMEEICKRRLFHPKTDNDIAREVIAAHICGKVANLETYIDELISLNQPYETALALMIAGFCDESVHAKAILSRFEGAKGFIGNAHAAAKDSYARNAWAKTWYEKMLNAQRAEDFWTASILFMKIVDGRFDIWSQSSGAASAVCAAFMPTIKREIDKRVAKIHKNREGKLFGGNAPSPIMLSTQ